MNIQKVHDLRDLSFCEYARKYVESKTESILKTIDRNYRNRAQMLEDLILTEIKNPTYEKLYKASNKDKTSTSIRQLAETAFAEETEQKAKNMGLDKSNELFSPFSKLEVEIQLFEMFGDIDTAVNLRMQQLMVCAAADELPRIVYWYAHADGCDDCKRMHDSVLPWVYDFIKLYKEKFTHPNCDDELREKPPIPFKYLEPKHDKLIPFGVLKAKKEKDNSPFSVVHDILDLVGFLPVIGTVADGVNAVFYAMEGDYVNAGLSLISAVPFVGWMSGGVRMAKVGAELTLKSQKASNLVGRINDASNTARRLKNITKSIDKNGKIGTYLDKISDTSSFIKNKDKYRSLSDILEAQIKASKNAKSADDLSKTILKRIKDVDSVSNANKQIVKNQKFQKMARENDFAKVLANDKEALIIKHKSKNKELKSQIEEIFIRDNKLKEIKETADNAYSQLKHLNNLHKSGKHDIISNKRPTAKQSEIDVAEDYPGASQQVSYLNGEKVSYGTKGSVRPDLVKGNVAIEVKNYNIEQKKGVHRLIYNVSKQIAKREIHLPKGMKQEIVIDIRGQNISNEHLEMIFASKLKNTKIRFKRE